MKRLWILPMFFLALLVPVAVLAGSGQGFDSVVRSVETRYHVHSTHIPFLGLASFIAGKATHGGVANLHMAEFENFSQAVDGDELNRMVQEKLGSGWERIIRETSRQGTDQTLIYMHPEGNRMGLFVVALDGRELNVIEVSVDPDHLDDDIGHYRHHHDKADGDESD
jgi:hypothetical protein